MENQDLPQYEFVTRDGRLVRSTKEGLKDIGEAYAFFDCKASKQGLEEDLAKYKAKTESKLELSLREVKDVLEGEELSQYLLNLIKGRAIYPTFPSRDRTPRETAKPTKVKDLKYMLAAKRLDATNQDVAQELGEIMNGVYNKYGDEKPFNFDVIAKIDGEYGSGGVVK